MAQNHVKSDVEKYFAANAVVNLIDDMSYKHINNENDKTDFAIDSLLLYLNFNIGKYLIK